jgi:8-hydroxy-5-deazaflavin:NADPH oxidoreductase
MKIAVFGTAVVGQTVGGKLAELGHQVVLGTRDVAASMARTGTDQFGRPPLPTWLAGQPAVTLASYPDAAAASELIVNATNGSGSIAALTAAGPDNLGTKVVVDIANALDFSGGFPPSLFVANTDSLSERLQRAFPQVRVVKTLNTVNAYVMVDPGQLGGGDHTVFVSGDDAAAKQTVTGLLTSFGWTDVFDLGDLSTARGPEMYVALWVRMLPVIGGENAFNIKVVR